jgi:hypothetical protein
VLARLHASTVRARKRVTRFELGANDMSSLAVQPKTSKFCASLGNITDVASFQVMLLITVHARTPSGGTLGVVGPAAPTASPEERFARQGPRGECLMPPGPAFVNVLARLPGTLFEWLGGWPHILVIDGHRALGRLPRQSPRRQVHQALDRRQRRHLGRGRAM